MAIGSDSRYIKCPAFPATVNSYIDNMIFIIYNYQVATAGMHGAFVGNPAEAR